MLSITLASADTDGQDEEELLDRLEEVKEDLKDNVIDASTRFTKKENNDEYK